MNDYDFFLVFMLTSVSMFFWCLWGVLRTLFPALCSQVVAPGLSPRGLLWLSPPPNRLR